MRALLIALAALLLVAPTADARKSQFMIFEAARELRSHDAGLRATTFDEIQRFGVEWIRIVMYWRDVAPATQGFDATDPAAYDWTVYDRVVDEARSRGLRVLITPSGPAPDWATLAGNGVDYPSPTHFERFMTAVGRQFGSRVQYWSIWNEPNHPQFLGPQYRRGRPYSPRLYRRLFWAAHRALDRTGNRRDRVLMGETAPRGNSNVVHPLRFLRGSLCLNGRYRKRRGCHKLPADGYAHHPYTTRAGPFFVSRRRDDVTIGSLWRLTRALSRCRARPRDPAPHAGIPDRVRHPEPARSGLRRQPDTPGGVPRHRREDRVEHGARPRHLAIPDAGRPAAPRAQPLRRLRVRLAPLERPQEACVPRVPAAHGGSQDRSSRPAVGPRASARRSRTRRDPVPRPTRPLAASQGRSDRPPRLLGDNDPLPAGSLISSSLASAARHALLGFAHARDALAGPLTIVGGMTTTPPVRKC